MTNKKQCYADSCKEESRKTGLCLKHYKRKRTHGELGLLATYVCKTCQTEISYRSYFATQNCNDCYSKVYYQENRQKWVESKIARKEELKKYCEDYYLKNREKLLQRDKERAKSKEYRAKRNARFQKYRQTRASIDPCYKIAYRLRGRLNAALRNGQKVGSAVKDLGCSIVDLKIYLEQRFQPGMSWDNYGKEWQIDHIKPLSGFNLQNVVEFKEACHYTNLQPLWKADHFKKTAEENRERIRELRKDCRQYS